MTHHQTPKLESYVSWSPLNCIASSMATKYNESILTEKQIPQKEMEIF